MTGGGGGGWSGDGLEEGRDRGDRTRGRKEVERGGVSVKSNESHPFPQQLHITTRRFCSLYIINFVYFCDFSLFILEWWETELWSYIMKVNIRL